MIGSTRSRIARVLAWAGVCMLAGAVSAAPYPFADDFESGLGAWQVSGPWGLTTLASRSPTHSASDSPVSFYGNNQDTAMSMASGVDLSGATRPALAFYNRHVLESGWDFVRVEVSTNGGADWTLLTGGLYTGKRSVWTRDQFDLDDYADQADVRVRFRLLTDASITMEGFFVDDVAIAERPEASTLAATTTTANTVALEWTASADPDFAAYRIYRSMTPGAHWHSARLVAEIDAASSNAWTDIAMAPKSSYYYRVMTVSVRGVHALGNEVDVHTLSGMDFPFLDDGEAGGAFWVADHPWALTEERSLSPAHSWADSPGTNYGPNANVSLTLSSPLNLLETVEPVLFFRQYAAFRPADFGYVEASVSGGASWTTLCATTPGTSVWSRVRVPLTAFTNSANVLLRFRVSTDASDHDEGWFLDDISVSESPPVVPAPVVTDTLSSSLRIAWATNSALAFSHYAVYRGTQADVDMNSGEWVATIPDRATTVFVDTGLSFDTTYYYRVYAVNPHGAYSATSAAAGSGRTTIHPLPFEDGFEDGPFQWIATGGWGVDTNNPASGSACISDSPDGQYSNSLHAANNGIRTAVSLAGSEAPVLRFRDRFNLAANDYGYLEVSPDGSSWTRLYSAQGGQADWREHEVCLMQWKGQANLRIRFWLSTDGSGVDDGWAIDDVRIADRAAPLLALPFYEGFEAGLDGWVESNLWAAVADNPYEEDFCANSAGRERFGPSAHYRLTLKGRFNLAAESNPVWVFWYRGAFEYRSYLYAEVSTDGGINWSAIWSHTFSNGHLADWARVQLSLTSYRATDVRFRFRAHSGSENPSPAMDLYLDKMTISDSPAAVEMVSLTPGVKTMGVTWSESVLGAAFQRYEVYRSPNTTVDLSSTLVGVFTNLSTVSMLDTDLTIGMRYYYGVYVLSDRDIYVRTPTVMSAETVPAPGIGFADSMETLDNWEATGGWGVDTNAPYTGSACISDSPTGHYGNSLNAANNGIRTAVSLAGSDVPVLRWRGRFALAANDYGFLEVSPDGSSWTRLYCAQGGQPDWSEHEVCLMQWKGLANLRIRFWLQTDGSGTADGWAIDDVRIENRSAEVLALPFLDGFEEGFVSRWVESNLWAVTAHQPYSGLKSLRSVPENIGFNTDRHLTLAGRLNLSETTNPTLSFWYRGAFEYHTTLRVDVSVNGGTSWSEIWSRNHNAGHVPDWTRVSLALVNYRAADVRLRFRLTSAASSNPGMDMRFDAIGIGDGAPGAPGIHVPVMGGDVNVLRPVLGVHNAADGENDPLTYRFEVYADAALSNLVAQVPAVAEGLIRTFWTVDTDLQDLTQYWWRCRAHDGTHLGPWSETATFYVNLFNRPPTAPRAASPGPGSIVETAAAYLSWHPSEDTNAGDRVTAYHVQTDTSPLFTSPTIDDAALTVSGTATGAAWVVAIPMQAMTGSSGLEAGRNYFWRVRACDTRGAWSEWSAEAMWFYFGIPAPTILGAQMAEGLMAFDIERTSRSVYVERSTNLLFDTWERIAGPFTGTNVVFEIPMDRPAGFFRMVTDE